MKIQIGKIVLNRTKKYLTPCILSYGKVFESKINGIIKVGIGIGDVITMKSGITFEKHIFILVDTAPTINPKVYNKKSFDKFLKWIKDQDMYEDDYAYDDVVTGHLHMIVIKLPQEHYKTFETFKRSQFSKMYTLADLNKFFDKMPEVQKILIKDSNYKIDFVKGLNKQFETTITPDEFEGELDFPIRKEEEVFNSHLK